jgi:hypothetical protein
MTKEQLIKEFGEKFPIEEILEAVDIGEGQGDVVPVGEAFSNKPDPEEIKKFILKAYSLGEQSQRKELVKKIEKLKPWRVVGALRTEQVYYETGYEEAISNTLSLLQDTNNKE